MATFDAADGTRLAYHQAGGGRPLICLPGGPMQASAYLGDLGGLSAHRALVLLDLRGTGASAVPADPASYRCDRLVDDVEALRAHLGPGRIDLLGHSAGATLALLYAARHPDRVGRLALVGPSPLAVGLEVGDADRRQVAELRRGEAWFPDAFAAFERIWSGAATAADWAAIAPFTYGRWDAAARANLAREASEQNADAAAAYYSPGALDPEATRAALARLPAPVLLVAGEYDVALPPKRAAEYAGLFRQAELAVQPGGGHYPWLDDAEWFVRTVAGFLHCQVRRLPVSAVTAGEHRRDHTAAREAAAMGLEDKAKNKAQELKGQGKEELGRATDDEELEAEGRTDQAKGDLKQAGEKVKDAFRR